MDDRLDRRLVAVMFTDMAGYTALMQEDEGAALEKRQRYWSVVEEFHDAFGGTVVQRLGDGSMSMFPSSLAAVQAAIGIQQELSARDVVMRIGIHVGEVIVEEERLTGEAVNIAARVESFATPGGVFLSDSAHEQIKNRSDVEVVALGPFRLKNVGRPIELYAVIAEGLGVPDPAALEGKGERLASIPSTLPGPRFPLVGRAVDLEALAELTTNNRVVTITGPGGVGKTTVLAELGRMLAPQFLEGTAFVSLADVTDSAGVLPALAEVLDVKEAEGRTLAEGVVTLIDGRQALLLLDNLEQVIAAGPDLASLVDRCPAVHLVTTSRTPLRIAAERVYPLASLGLPPTSERTSIESLLTYPSVVLFVERARRTNASFELTSENAAAVAAVCRRLDGLPLALELAAARSRLLSPDALLERLDHALDVLTSGDRDAPQRQQTLRATIAWSHSLLSEAEQQLFRRLAVFAGSCTVPDVEAVCFESATRSALDQLESLVDKALVQVDTHGDQLRLLQTIREFAGEQLEVAGEGGEIALRHARRYADRAREIRVGIEGIGQVSSVERGIAEEANLQAALDCLLRNARAGDEASTELGMQICGDLWMYWHIRGKNVSAREYATAFLEADGRSTPTPGRAGALITTALASWMLGQYQQSLDEADHATKIAEDLGAQREICVGHLMQALALIFVDPARGLRCAAQGAETSRAAGFAWSEGLAYTLAGILYATTGDVESSQARYASALQIQRRLGDCEGAGMSLGGLAELAMACGDAADALELYQQSLAAFQTIGDRGEEARILSEIAWTYLADANPERARETFFESVQAHIDLASVRGVGHSLIGLAAAEVAEHRPAKALLIAAAAEVYAQEDGIAVIYSEDAPGRAFIDRALATLSSEEAARIREAGSRLTINEALDLARTP